MKSETILNRWECSSKHFSCKSVANISDIYNLSFYYFLTMLSDLYFLCLLTFALLTNSASANWSAVPGQQTGLNTHKPFAKVRALQTAGQHSKCIANCFEASRSKAENRRLNTDCEKARLSYGTGIDCFVTCGNEFREDPDSLCPTTCNFDDLCISFTRSWDFSTDEGTDTFDLNVFLSGELGASCVTSCDEVKVITFTTAGPSNQAPSVLPSQPSQAPAALDSPSIPPPTGTDPLALGLGLGLGLGIPLFLLVVYVGVTSTRSTKKAEAESSSDHPSEETGKHAQSSDPSADDKDKYTDMRKA